MSVRLKRYIFSERGDTIIEVMIVLAVLSLALGISYATANRSLLQMREAQENSIATQLLEQQIELMSTKVTSDPSDAANNIFRVSDFCIDTGSLNVVTWTLNACSPPGAVPYDIRINYNSATNDTFRLTAQWDNVRGQGKDTVTLFHRLHRPVP